MKSIVTLPYNSEWHAVEWAKKHCPSYITNDVVNSEPLTPGGEYFIPSNINYYFGSEKDALIFALHWL